MTFSNLQFELIPSIFGEISVVWSMNNGILKIRRIFLASPDFPAETKMNGVFPNLARGRPRELEPVIGDIEAFLAGVDVRFSFDQLVIPEPKTLQWQILVMEAGIPRGSVSTYQRLAEHAGIPRGARVVGNALARNPYPLIIPCHRAVRSDGSLGGFQGGVAMKRALLEMEGVEFDGRGRVKLDWVHY